MSELEYTQKKQEQYRNQVVDAVKQTITEGSDKRLNGWLGASDLLVVNGKTGKNINGLNAVCLNLAGYDDPRWLTFEQIKELGGTTRKGQAGKIVEFASFSKFTPKTDPYGGVIFNEEGKKVYTEEKLDIPVYKYYTLFNLEQSFNIDKAKLVAIPPKNLAASKEDIEQRAKRIDSLVEKLAIKVVHRQEKTASYDAVKDEITMPDKNSIPSEQYYGALLNQTVRATANPSRLKDRDISSAFGTKEYAKEVLSVELASMLLTREFGVRANANLDKDFATAGTTNIASLKEWVRNGTLNDTDIKDSFYKSLKSQRLILRNSIVEKTVSITKEAKQPIKEAEKAVEKKVAIQITKPTIPPAKTKKIDKGRGR